MQTTSVFSKRKPICVDCARRGSICQRCEHLARSMFQQGLPRVGRSQKVTFRDWSLYPKPIECRTMSVHATPLVPVRRTANVGTKYGRASFFI